jgi:glycogen operon protein
MLILLNAHHEKMDFTLPGPDDGPRWQVMFDTNMPSTNGDRNAGGGEIFELQPRSLVLLRQPQETL